MKKRNPRWQGSSPQSPGKFRQALRQDLLAPSPVLVPIPHALWSILPQMSPPMPFPVFINCLQLTALLLNHPALPPEGESLGTSLEPCEMRSSSVHLVPNAPGRTQLPCSDPASPTPVGKGEGWVHWKEGIWLSTNNEDGLITEQLHALL